MNKHEVHVGMIVEFTHKGKVRVGMVKKVMQKNIRVQTDDGLLWTASPGLLSPSTREYKPLDTSKILSLGSVVEFTPQKGSMGHYVVINSNADNLYKIAPLGGVGSIYRGIPAGRLTKVNIDLEVV